MTPPARLMFDMNGSRRVGIGNVNTWGIALSGWQLSGDAPSLYNRFAIRAMEQWTDDLIRQANCKDGDRVLDVACGTGFVTMRVEEVSGANCKLTGLDVNEGMLNAAWKNFGVDWHLGSATAMPFPDASFDVVLCQQGLQYFPDRQAAMNEISRVLAPGGRVALNVWGTMDRQVFFAAAGILRRVGGGMRHPVRWSARNGWQLTGWSCPWPASACWSRPGSGSASTWRSGGGHLVMDAVTRIAGEMRLYHWGRISEPPDSGRRGIPQCGIASLVMG